MCAKFLQKQENLYFCIGKNNKLMAKKISISLNESDVKYGIIHLSALSKEEKKILPKAGEEFTICCDNEKRMVKIPSHFGYISGLTRLHRQHRATIGDTVEIWIYKGEVHLAYPFSMESKTVNAEEKGLLDVVRNAANLLDTYQWLFMKEENVRGEIIDPILQSLGWEFPDLRREVSFRSGEADYVLYKDVNQAIDESCEIPEPVVIIEAKNLDIELDKEELEKQLMNYVCHLSAATKEQLIAIATNGRYWLFWVFSLKNNSLEFINCIDIKSVDDFSSAISLLSYNIVKKDSVIEKIKKLERQDLTKIAKTRNVGFSITGFDGYETREALKQLILKHEDDVIRMAKNGHFAKIVAAENLENAKKELGERMLTTFIKNDKRRQEKLFCEKLYPIDMRMIAEQIIFELKMYKHIGIDYQVIKKKGENNKKNDHA
jgi:predicted type IV restriction endonuclease